VEVLVVMTFWLLSAVLAQDTTTPAPPATPSCPAGEHYERATDGKMACLPILPVSQPAGQSGVAAAAPLPLSGAPKLVPLYEGVYLDMGPVILGALDKVLIDQVLKTTGGALHACYVPRLAERPTLEGTVKVKFVIAKDGTVSSATIKSIDDALRDEALAVCVLNTIRGLKFPEPKGGGIVIASYPFTFDAREATAPEAPQAPAP
jgi:hypothetical protein